MSSILTDIDTAKKVMKVLGDRKPEGYFFSEHWYIHRVTCVNGQDCAEYYVEIKAEQIGVFDLENIISLAHIGAEMLLKETTEREGNILFGEILVVD